MTTHKSHIIRFCIKNYTIQIYSQHFSFVLMEISNENTYENVIKLSVPRAWSTCFPVPFPAPVFRLFFCCYLTSFSNQHGDDGLGKKWFDILFRPHWIKEQSTAHFLCGIELTKIKTICTVSITLVRRGSNFKRPLIYWCLGIRP